MVYFIQAGESDRFKIGKANDVKHRIKTLQTGCPYKIRLIASYNFVTEMEAKRAEGFLHEAFSGSRVVGEWFRYGEREQLAIARICQKGSLTTDRMVAIAKYELTREWRDHEMNKDQLNAFVALAGGDKLVDPKYAPHPKQAEERLKAQVKECWNHRASFPEWVTAYCKKWEAQNVRGDQRPVSESHDMAAVRSPDEGRRMA